MEKGIESEENNLYKQTDDVAENVIGKLNNVRENVNLNTNSNDLSSGHIIDYDKMANAITKALTNCKFTLDEDGFAKIVKDELYKVV